MADVDISSEGVKIANAYDAERGTPSTVEKEAGTETGVRAFSPADVAEMAGLHGNMAKLGTATVAGAAATTMTVSGLDLSAYTAFKVLVVLQNATGSAAGVRLYYNSDTTDTNYYRQFLQANNTTISGQRLNSPLVIPFGANDDVITTIDIMADVAGRPRAMVYNNVSAAASIYMVNYNHIWNSATNVTSITVSSNVASSIEIGSKMIVYGIA